MTSLTAQPTPAQRDTVGIARAGSAARGRKGAEVAGPSRRPTTAQRSCRASGVQRDTNSASAAGQGVGQEALRALSAFQRLGYDRAGKLGRVKECGTVPIVHGRVALGVTPKGGVQTCGLARCGCRWCTDCWNKVAVHRGDEIRQVAKWADSAGHRIVLVTLTAAHVQNSVLEEAGGDMLTALMKQDVKQVFDGLAAAWRYAHSGRGGKALKDERIGYARAFELTTDSLFAKERTGVHGHFHVLLVMDADADVRAHCRALWRRWEKGCAKQDLATNRKGYDWKVLMVGDSGNVEAAASYLVKGEKLTAEKIGMELTRSDVKQSETRTSPEGLLRMIGQLDEDSPDMARGIAMWRGIEEACRGRRWLTWSRDLRAMAGLGDEMEDAEIAQQDQDVESGRLVVVTWEDVREHLDEIRSAVQEAPTAKKWETLELCLAGLGVDTEETTQDEWRSRVAEYMRGLSELRRNGER